MLIFGCACSAVTHSGQIEWPWYCISTALSSTRTCVALLRVPILCISAFVARIWKNMQRISAVVEQVATQLKRSILYPLRMHRIDTVCTSPRRTIFLAALLLAKRAGNVCISADAKPTRAWAAEGWKHICELWMNSWECESHHITAQVHSASQTNISSKQTLKHMVCLLLFHTCAHAFTERSHFA